MVCKNCGYNVQEGDECPYCGTKVKEFWKPIRSESTEYADPDEVQSPQVSRPSRIRSTASAVLKKVGWIEKSDGPPRSLPSLTEVAERRQAVAGPEKAKRLRKRIALWVLGAGAAVCIIGAVADNINSQVYADALIESKDVRTTKRLFDNGDLAITADKVDRLKSWNGKAAEEGMEYLAVHVTVDNLSEESDSVYYEGFSVVDSSGETSKCIDSQGFILRTIDKGETREGLLVFTVRTGAGATLWYVSLASRSALSFPLFSPAF